MADLESLIAKTQEMVGAIIERPKMSEKHLKRPPFRFLHDTFMSMNKATGFIDNLYSGSELEAKQIGDRAGKVAFLQKMLTFLYHATGQEVPCKPTKVVAGAESENTNIFMQSAASVAARGDAASCQRAVRLTLGLGEDEGKQATEESKSQEAPMERRGSNASSSSRRDSNASAASGASSGASTEVHIPGIDGNWETTKNLFEGLISKPRMTEKHLSKPPFRFLHDIVTQTMRTVPGFLEGLFEEHELDSSQIKDRTGKIEFLTKLGQHVAQKFSSNVPCRPAKVVAGHEPEKTNCLLQMVALLAHQQREGGEVNPPGQEQKQPDASSAQEEAKQATTEEQKVEPSAPAQRPKEKEKEAPARNPTPEPAEAKVQDEEKAAANARRTARPATARKRPPKLKNTVEEIENRPGGAADAKEVRPAGVMVEGEDSESDADELAEQEGDELNGERVLMDPRERTGSMASVGGPKGKLLQNILDEEGKSQGPKEDQEAEAKVTENGISLGRIGNSLRKGRGGKGAHSAVDIDHLRKAIQLLCQSTNPLGKCMDYVNEDMAIMGKELEKWRAEYRKHCDVLDEEERKTKDEILPLAQKLRETEEAMKDQASKITLLKAKIAKNEMRIQEQMRRMITG